MEKDKENILKFEHCGLFEGIGGFSEAASWMGWNTALWCEINPYLQAVLRVMHPMADAYSDITKSKFTKYANRIDLLTGGFPCQPYSTSGKREGKEDPRHLWPEMFRAIREIKPPFVVGENVSGIISWNKGMVFHEIQTQMETEGYEITPFILPACGVNAPHRRDRVWFIGFSEQNQRARQSFIENTNKNGWSCNDRQIKTSIGEQWYTGAGDNEQLRTDYEKTRDATNANGSGLQISAIRSSNEEKINTQSQRSCSTSDATQSRARFNTIGKLIDWSNFPTQSPIRTGNDGLLCQSLRSFIRSNDVGILTEKEINKIVSKAITNVRKEAIKAGGNAVVPQVVYRIYLAIQKFVELYSVQ